MAREICEYGPVGEADPSYSGLNLATLEIIHTRIALGIDVDRTVVNCDGAIPRLARAAEPYGITQGDLDAAAKLDKDAGSSFEPYGPIERRLQELHPDSNGAWLDSMKAIRGDFRRAKDTPLLYEDAEPFLRGVRQSPGQPAIAATYVTAAVRRQWQRDKIASAEAEIDDGSEIGIHAEIIDVTRTPHGIAKTPPKFPTINSWCREDGSCEFVGIDTNRNPIALVVARGILLIDDKAPAFGGMRHDSHGGFLLRRPGETVLKSQAGEAPPNVETIASLGEISLRGIREKDPYFDHRLAPKIVAFVPAVRWMLAS